MEVDDKVFFKAISDQLIFGTADQTAARSDVMHTFSAVVSGSDLRVFRVQHVAANAVLVPRVAPSISLASQTSPASPLKVLQKKKKKNTSTV